MKIIFIILFIIIGLFLIDKLLLHLEAKGYIYWRKVKPGSGSHSNAIQLLDEIFHPASKYMYEEKEKQKSITIDNKQKGDKPNKDS